MTARVIDAAQVAAPYRAETREWVARLGREFRVVGLLSQSEGPAYTYAQYARSGCGCRSSIVMPASSAPRRAYCA